MRVGELNIMDELMVTDADAMFQLGGVQCARCNQMRLKGSKCPNCLAAKAAAGQPNAKRRRMPQSSEQSSSSVGGVKGARLCEHNKQPSRCRECGGGAFCRHDRRMELCNECKAAGVKGAGTAMCEHKKRRDECRECGGGAFCRHDRWKRSCKECKAGG